MSSGGDPGSGRAREAGGTVGMETNAQALYPTHSPQVNVVHDQLQMGSELRQHTCLFKSFHLTGWF